MASICVAMTSMKCSTFRRETRNYCWQKNGRLPSAVLLTFRTSLNGARVLTTFREIEPLIAGELEP